MKQRILSILFLIIGFLSANAQNNTLKIPSVTSSPGQTISLPVILDNTADVVAIQFTLVVPEGISLHPASAALSERAEGLSIVMRETARNKYMTMIFSPNNQVIPGRTGTLMTVPMTVSSDLTEGMTLPMTLSGVVIGRSDGSNIATGFDAGEIKIAKSVDLEVSNVQVGSSSIYPGEKVYLSWQVSNIGETSTKSGWSEQIVLNGNDGGSKVLSTVYYENPLNSNGVVSRHAEISVPEILGISGEGRISVKLSPNRDAGEPSWLLDNNTAYGGSEIHIGKILYLTPETINVVERSNEYVRLLLSRSGSVDSDETFSINPTADSRLTIPANVTIPKGQSGVYLYIKVEANNRLDDNSPISLNISGAGYGTVKSSLIIEDDTYPSLSIESEAEKVTEGESVIFTISAERAPKEDLAIILTCDFANRFNIPNVILPAGQNSVEVSVEAKDDNIPDALHFVTFTASAAGYISSSDVIDLMDNDIPALTLLLTPNAVSEGIGPVGIVATLQRTDNIDKAVTIKFSDDSNGNIYYGRQSVEMAAGVKEVTVNLGPIDNAIVDGERTYHITASVWIPSCSCSATSGKSGGEVTVPLTVYDNDGPALSLSSSTSTLREGEEITVSVSRNTESIKELTVKISCDNDENLKYPSAITIPAGEASASFKVSSIKDNTNNDDFIAVLTVECEDYAKGNIWFLVSNQDLPDAKISYIEVSNAHIEVGEPITVNVTVTNGGSYDLPELTKVGIYQNGNSNALGIAYLQTSLTPGSNITISKVISLPDAVGKYSLFAVVNDGQGAKELLYTNNTSANVDVEILSPFTFNINTDKNIYQQNETVNIKGWIQGKKVSGKNVEIYVINEGYRHSMSAETDEDGSFSVDFKPYEGQIGHFDVGACYPNEGILESLASFDVLGLKRSNNDALVCKTLYGKEFNGSFSITNPGSISLTNINASIVAKPDNCLVEVQSPSNLEGRNSAEVNFKIIPTALSDGNEWQRIVFDITTNEGVSLRVPVGFYCYNPNGQLQSSVATIRTTMVKDSTRDYPFEITNIGEGSTGKITLALPSWMGALTPVEVAPLESGESTTVILQLSPDENMQLNVPVTGQIGINCEDGEGLALPFVIEPVSEVMGVLTIDVCDEYTYYTAEAPHVQGAQIKVTHPTTGEVLAKGVSDENGIFSTTLKEGYYTVYVNAERHDSYKNNVLVDPGSEKKLTVNLSVEAITISWDVEETEVQDEYKIVTTTTFETNVPTPVVEMIVPKRIPADELKEGESLIFNATLTNHGLITAKDVQVLMPEGFSKLHFEPLAYAEPFDLAPHQSVNVPIKVSRNRLTSQMQLKAARYVDDDPCVAQPGTLYFWECGSDGKLHRVRVAVQVGSCKSDDPSTWNSSVSNNVYNPGGGGPGWGSPYGGGGGSYYSSSSSSPGISTISNDCHPLPPRNCMPGALAGCGLAGAGCVPGAGVGFQVAGCATSLGLSCTNMTSWWDVVNCGLAGGGCIPGPVGCAFGATGCLSGVAQCLVDGDSQRNSAKGSRANMRIKGNDILILSDVLNAMKERFLEIVGNNVWMNVSQNDLDNILDYVNDHVDKDGRLIIGDDWLSIKPEMISQDDMRELLERFSNTAAIESGAILNSQNSINMNTIQLYNEQMQSYKQEMLEKGYDDYLDFIDDVTSYLQEVLENTEEESNSVCSSITLQFEQRLVMTRQAFRGTLNVFNGNETIPMTDIKLNITVTNDAGEIATSHEFQINPESIDGFEGSLGFEQGWTLQPQETGVAKILFIPTKFAAATIEQKYDFGGSLSYTDPFTGLTVTRDLTPVTLTVNPSPNLNLTYFMQRDIIGDDPLTETIEPGEEAEFSLLINNLGYGDATNVRMITEQPRIVNNEKGLLIDFEILSSQLNGCDKTMALGTSVATDFGTIPAKGTSFAQWWFKSSLLGHFTKYNVEATHLISYDNPDLSLLNEVTIHELIRSIDVAEGQDELKGFMTNDIVDQEDTPDMLYLSNGEVKPVSAIDLPSIVRISDTEYNLTISPKSIGWNYGYISDPTYGVVKLQRIVRKSDNKEIRLRNFWQTDRVLRDGKDPLYENRIHFIDNFKDLASETYQLIFEPIPELLLEVASIEGMPEEGTIANIPVEKLNIMFNKYIDPSTFTPEDISFSVQGINQDTSLVEISTEDNKTFTLDLSELNKTFGNGFIVLTVQTSGITDIEGYTGKNGKCVSWNMVTDGILLINAEVSPKNAGTITGPHNVQYGESVILTAEPNTGYIFSHWTTGGEEASRDAAWNTIAFSDMNVTAIFIPKIFSVDIDASISGGVIQGCGSGLYDYGEDVNLIAIADEGYKFNYWIINGKNTSDDESLILSVTEDMEISASFKYVGQYTLQRKIAVGWNWLSHYLLPYQSTDIIMTDENIAKIQSQTQETIRDPQIGVVGNLTALYPVESYKLVATGRTSIIMSGYEIWNSATPIALNYGWNWLGYPMGETMSVDEALANTKAETLDVIVGQNGFAQFDGENWIGTLETMSPGMGYMYQSRSAKNVVYNTSIVSTASAKFVPGIAANSPLVLDIHKYGVIMPVVATLNSVDGSELDNSDYQVAAFSGSECRGIGRIVEGRVMMNVYGNVNDPITFHVTDASGEKSFINSASLDFSERIVGDIYDPYAITIDVRSGVENVRYDGNVKVSVDGDMLLIKGISADEIALVEVYDIEGQKLILETHISESGINISNLTKGVYVVIVNGNGDYTYHKIAVR